MAAVLFYHVVGDLTIGKPKLPQFVETSSVGEALQVLQGSRLLELPVWRHSEDNSSSLETMQERFVGMIDMFDIVGHMASEKSLKDSEGGLSVSVSEIVVPNNSLLKHVAPATSLYDALELMKQGARQLLVPLIRNWRIISKRFSMLYYGKWIDAVDLNAEDQNEQDFCLLTREDLIRFLIGHMGALAPLPLTSIEALGVINKNMIILEEAAPASTALAMRRMSPFQEIEAIAVVRKHDEINGKWIIVGEISKFQLRQCNCKEAAWAMAEASALELVLLCDLKHAKYTKNQRDLRSISTQEIKPPIRQGLRGSFSSPSCSYSSTTSTDIGTLSVVSHSSTPCSKPFLLDAGNSPNPASSSIKISQKATSIRNDNHFSLPETDNKKPPKSSTRSSDESNTQDPINDDGNQQPKLFRANSSTRIHRTSRGWREPIICKPNLSLAAVMTQLLTYGATHIWVNDESGALMGVVTYLEIITALARPLVPANVSSSSLSSTCRAQEDLVR